MSADTKTILGMECYSRERTASELGISTASLDTLLAKTRANIAKVPIRYIQLCKNSPVWFPRPWLEEFLNSVADAGGAY